VLTIVEQKHNVKSGTFFGSWEVIGKPFKCGKRWFVVAKCNCSSSHVVRTDVLSKGGSLQCDECKYKGRVGQTVWKKHGEHKSKLYGVWSSMKGRCGNPKDRHYANYGGRGITVCDEWKKDFVKFKEWAIAAGYAPGLHIDRIDNDSGYSPNNCRFVTQAKNNLNRRNSTSVNAFGESKTVKEWSNDARCVVSYKTLEARLRYGHDPEKAIATVPHKSHV
jgi:hypothetical protein